MPGQVLLFVCFGFLLWSENGDSQPLGITNDDGRCKAEDYILNLRSYMISYMNDQLSNLEKRLKEDFSQKIQDLKTQNKQPTNCPQGWKKYGKSCYKLNTQMLTWTAANQLCRGLSGKLAEVGDKSENDFITNIIKDNTGTERVWIGGVDKAREGTWIWSFSGLPLSFTNWNKGEPNDDKGNEDCMEIFGTNNGLWNDRSCSDLAASVCEKDL